MGKKFDGSNPQGTDVVTSLDGTEYVRVRKTNGQEVLVQLAVLKAYINS